VNNFEPVKPDVIINTSTEDIEQKGEDPEMKYVLEKIKIN
jgi:hypothetical protein